MSATEAHNASGDAPVTNVDIHLEIEVLPVSDVDRAKKFYQRLGWRLDDDVAPLDGLRIVQFTPPGSGASITFGLGLTPAPTPPPGAPGRSSPSPPPTATPGSSRKSPPAAPAVPTPPAPPSGPR